MALGFCEKCGVQLKSHVNKTRVCIACYSVSPKFCEKCGGALDRYTKAKQCRACWSSRGSTGPRSEKPTRQSKRVRRYCERCNRELFGDPLKTLCRTCGVQPGRRCDDCGIELPPKSRSGKRCRSCWFAYRQSAARHKQCSVEGCINSHQARGLCMTHYQQAHHAQEIQATAKFRRNAIAELPCQLCGYSKLRSHIHRVTHGAEGGKYVIGNVIALCARCHEEVHRGITPCPEPLPVSAHHSPTRTVRQ